METQMELPGRDAEQVTLWLNGTPCMAGWYDTRFQSTEGVVGTIVSRRLWRGYAAGWSKPAAPRWDERRTLWLARTDDECPVDRTLMQFRGLVTPAPAHQYMVILGLDVVRTAISQRVRAQVDMVVPDEPTLVPTQTARVRVRALVP